MYTSEYGTTTLQLKAVVLKTRNNNFRPILRSTEFFPYLFCFENKINEKSRKSCKPQKICTILPFRTIALIIIIFAVLKKSSLYSQCC